MNHISNAPRDGTVIVGRYEGMHPGLCPIAWVRWPGCSPDWCEVDMGTMTVAGPAFGEPVGWMPTEKRLKAHVSGMIV